VQHFLPIIAGVDNHGLCKLPRCIYARLVKATPQTLVRVPWLEDTGGNGDQQRFPKAAP
jgi:hypothetical protein